MTVKEMGLPSESSAAFFVSRSVVAGQPMLKVALIIIALGFLLWVVAWRLIGFGQTSAQVYHAAGEDRMKNGATLAGKSLKLIGYIILIVMLARILFGLL